jgi:folylpolyglutamate synthase/dihydropteroate synthase
VIVDAAHNPAGAGALAEAIRAGRPELGGDKAIVVMGCQATKDIAGMLTPLMSAADEIIACRLPDSGGQEGNDPADPEVIASVVAERGGRKLTAESVRSAIRRASHLPDGIALSLRRGAGGEWGAGAVGSDSEKQKARRAAGLPDHLRETSTPGSARIP